MRYLTPFLHSLIMAPEDDPAGGTGGTGGAGGAGGAGGDDGNETFLFDLNGTKAEVPVALKDALIQFRDGHKGKTNEMSQQIAQLQARLEALDSAKAEQEEQQRLKALTDSQKWDEARSLLEEKHKAQIATVEKRQAALESRLVRSKLESVVAAHPDLRRYDDVEQQRTLVADIVQQLAPGVVYDAEVDDLVAMKPDGSGPAMEADGPRRVDALVSRYLDARPHLKQAKQNPGSGATGSKGGTGGDDGDNPFVTGNKTQQQMLMQKDPARAQRLAAAAGVDISNLIAALGG